ncbi:hypothetical protein SK128_017431, partial [Halocaridina rubra]
MRNALQPRRPKTQIHPGGLILIYVARMLQQLDNNVSSAENFLISPPWKLPFPAVFFVPTSKVYLLALQKQLALETIETDFFSVPTPHHIYMDRSVQLD